MSRRKKWLLALLGAAALLAIAAFAIINSLLDKASQQALNQVVSLAEQRGMEIVEPNYETVGLSGPLTATWSNLQTSIRLPDDSDSGSNQLWNIKADQLSVTGSVSGSATLKVDHAMVTSTTDQLEESDEVVPVPAKTLDLRDIVCKCDVQLLNPTASLQELLPQVIQLLSESNMQLPFDLHGTLAFQLQEQPTTLRVEVQKRDGVHQMQLNREDLAKISERFNERLTEDEITILAEYPLRAARLLQIKEAAESTSEAAHQNNPAVPEDAYRHVLWSFFLANTYDEAFAKRVGDAHEHGETGNTPAERAMDLHNNAIGRQYAMEGYGKASILPRLLKDPNVLRTPDTQSDE